MRDAAMARTDLRAPGAKWAWAVACLSLAAIALPASGHAQRPDPAGMQRDSSAAPHAPALGDSLSVEGDPVARRLARIPASTAPRREAGSSPWWAPVASAVVPGTGQAALDQDRWIAYAAFEGLAWLRFVSDRQEALREQKSYRRIANQVARALFTTGTPPSGSFEYYETMEKWASSGVYDEMSDDGLQPETDSTTFNGAMWLLARQTYWADINEPPLPESDAYRNAVAFYSRRAIPPSFRWSWQDAQLQQDLYRRAILHSNAAYRRATQDLAAVLANHVLSTVDAYVTLRLRRRPGPTGGETWIEATLPWP